MMGGYVFKYFIFSGRDPTAEMTTDGASVVVGGIRWFMKEDMISLIILKFNFSRKKCGRKKMLMVLDDFILGITKPNCVSCAYEILTPKACTAL